MRVDMAEKHRISKKRCRQKINALVNSLYLPDLDEASLLPFLRMKVRKQMICGDVVHELCYSIAIEDFKDGTASSSLLVNFSAVQGLSRPAGDENLRPYHSCPCCRD
ncbi:Uncharacterized protein HZ326_25066 [Fusarium oxysporum f. sp. albedinis]|nr:Uncharacterized protein HZ326_25066 [Fusarium oxysporum f. sp. albedinis]